MANSHSHSPGITHLPLPAEMSTDHDYSVTFGVHSKCFSHPGKMKYPTVHNSLQNCHNLHHVVLNLCDFSFFCGAQNKIFQKYLLLLWSLKGKSTGSNVILSSGQKRLKHSLKYIFFPLQQKVGLGWQNPVFSMNLGNADSINWVKKYK